MLSLKKYQGESNRKKEHKQDYCCFIKRKSTVKGYNPSNKRVLQISFKKNMNSLERNKPFRSMGTLTFEEKKFLLAVERGDVASVRR